MTLAEEYKKEKSSFNHMMKRLYLTFTKRGWAKTSNRSKWFQPKLKES
jgi:hypothetical protein